LKEFFAPICAINVPDIGNLPLFKEQIQWFQNILAEIAQSRHDNGQLLDKRCWLELYKRVLEPISSNKSVNLRQIFFDVMKVGSRSKEAALIAFNELYSTFLDDKYALFERSVKLGLAFLARNLALELYQKHKHNLHVMFPEWVDEYALTFFDECWQIWEKKKPCYARFHKGDIIKKCSLLKDQHKNLHMTAHPSTIPILGSADSWKDGKEFVSSPEEVTCEERKGKFQQNFRTHLRNFKENPNYEFSGFRDICNQFNLQIVPSEMERVCLCCLLRMEDIRITLWSSRKFGIVDSTCYSKCCQ